MTNFEKYKDEILEISKIGTIAVNKQKNMPVHCSTTPCSECILRSDTRTSQLINWLYEEYQEPAPKLTKDEAIFCNIVDGFIARDKDGSLALYSSEPYLENECWFDSDTEARGATIKSDLFPFITYKSEKYWSIEDLLKLEVEE